jgi:hypothetical protein
MPQGRLLRFSPNVQLAHHAKEAICGDFLTLCLVFLVIDSIVDNITDLQIETCLRLSVPFLKPDPWMKIGINRTFEMSRFPINGLRHAPENGTTGWYIWSGTYSDDENFFESRHLYHFYETNPQISKYLGLSSSWRFLLAPDYEDVWVDPNLLIT